ncbi:hypothetical protein JD77_05499 [Micromonospora olivasterospora]|uniref:Uncharacterized protein n=1 Tax=Micromonospora olivasterospora TaxID=1880 RepID=A0A562IIM2_MICOL|nr:hypothetical protein JD77_05499 [Micromonospora olivasterospora]
MQGERGRAELAAPPGPPSSRRAATYARETRCSSRDAAPTGTAAGASSGATSTRRSTAVSTAWTHSAQAWSSGTYRNTISSSTITGLRSKRCTVCRRSPSSMRGSAVTRPPVMCRVSDSYADSRPRLPGTSPKVARVSS